MASGRENPLLLFCFVALLFVIVGWRQVLRPRLTWAWRNIFYGLLDIFKNRQLIGKKHLARDKGRVWCGTPLILARRGRGQWVLWVQASQKRRVRPCLKKKNKQKEDSQLWGRTGNLVYHFLVLVDFNFSFGVQVWCFLPFPHFCFYVSWGLSVAGRGDSNADCVEFP